MTNQSELFVLIDNFIKSTNEGIFILYDGKDINLYTTKGMKARGIILKGFVKSILNGWEKEDKDIEQRSYSDYIKSEDWAKKSTEAKERACWRCQLCNKSKEETTLHTHHRTYENLYDELPEDLIVLCKDCHAKFHDIIA
jgi:hypothetical protein